MLFPLLIENFLCNFSSSTSYQRCIFVFGFGLIFCLRVRGHFFEGLINVYGE